MAFPKCNLDRIPADLKENALFCCWRYEERDGRMTKVPYAPQTGSRAKSNDQSTFTRFDIAAAQADRGYDGLGVGMFAPLAGIDIDHCVDASGGLSELARAVMDTMQSYTEISPSGTGIRILFRATLGISKDDYRQRYFFKDSPAAAGMEIYLGGMTSRYLTVTGNAINSAGIEDRTAAIQVVLQTYMLRKPDVQQPPFLPSVLSLSDSDLIDRACRASNGAQFRQLWIGDITGHDSQSHADMALCGMLAFWTCKDPVRMDALFRQSGLYREKWERQDYREATIATAIKNCQAVYTGNRNAQPGGDFNLQSLLDTPVAIGQPDARPEPQPKDFSEYYSRCEFMLSHAVPEAYLERRGISIQTAVACHVGFDAEADPAFAPGGVGVKKHAAPRLIVPCSPTYYVSKAIDVVTPKKFVDLAPKGCTSDLFCYLQNNGEAPTFLTLSAFDALAVAEAGRDVIALCSHGNADRFIRIAEQNPFPGIVIICLNKDRDRETLATVKTGLQRLSVPCIVADITCGYDSAYDALAGDRTAFLAAIEKAVKQTAAKPDTISAYILDEQGGMTADMAAFKGTYKTDFPHLDQCSGGLKAGLYAVAAISSLGKTTFVHQICDNIAAAGHDVLFFSLEQSRLELASKSIARIHAQEAGTNGARVSSLSIRQGYVPDSVKEAARLYLEKVEDRLSVIEGNFRSDMTYIGEYVRSYCKRNGTRPLVCVDYLQILQPSPDKQGRLPGTAKDAVDANVVALKRLSRDLAIPVIVISAVNRANYLLPISFESLKESGSVEYSCDVVWGLQLTCLDEDLFASSQNLTEKRQRVTEAKAENPRKVTLTCLKNRFGVASYKVDFDYFPQSDLFVETGPIEVKILSSWHPKATTL